ncbi:MAG TPA: hypothetical protein VK815_04520 [Candidatus Acidoferrales bacterium]|nr:hypothetical protein [Candidatus Acidoferrales bacterium]
MSTIPDNPPARRAEAMHMKTMLMRIGGLLMAPVSLFGLFFGQPFTWLVCPQALVVMFLRQSQHAYDSLGAAGYPDLAVALLYYPLVGWILSRASKAGRFQRIAIYIVICHIAAIVLAVWTCEMRNRIWGFK